MQNNRNISTGLFGTSRSVNRNVLHFIDLDAFEVRME